MTLTRSVVSVVPEISVRPQRTFRADQFSYRWNWKFDIPGPHRTRDLFADADCSSNSILRCCYGDPATTRGRR